MVALSVRYSKIEAFNFIHKFQFYQLEAPRPHFRTQQAFLLDILNSNCGQPIAVRFRNLDFPSGLGMLGRYALWYNRIKRNEGGAF